MESEKGHRVMASSDEDELASLRASRTVRVGDGIRDLVWNLPKAQGTAQKIGASEKY